MAGVTKAPRLVKVHVRSFYGESQVDVATDAGMIRLDAHTEKVVYLLPDAADELGRALVAAAKVVKGRKPR